MAVPRDADWKNWRRRRRDDINRLRRQQRRYRTAELGRYE
jgi:hypothetical protein